MQEREKYKEVRRLELPETGGVNKRSRARNRVRIVMAILAVVLLLIGLIRLWEFSHMKGSGERMKWEEK